MGCRKDCQGRATRLSPRRPPNGRWRLPQRWPAVDSSCRDAQLRAKEALLADVRRQLTEHRQNVYTLNRDLEAQKQLVSPLARHAAVLVDLPGLNLTSFGQARWASS